MGVLYSTLFITTTVTRVQFATKPALVKVLDSCTSEEPESLSLEDLVNKRCPNVRNPFSPVWWLPTSDFQTAYSALGNLSHLHRVDFSSGLDFTVPSDPISDETPIIVTLPGLTGGSHESYIRAVIEPACSPVAAGGLGYRGVVLNFRGCGGVPLTSPRLYSAGCTADLRIALLHVSMLHPNAPILGVGFSLGASILARYLAEEGPRSRFKAATVLGCPWDLVANGEKIISTPWRKHVYAKALGTNLRAVVKKHATQLAGCSELALALPQVLALSRPRLDEFDSIITCIVGGSSPAFPFATVRDYYSWASCQRLMADIRVPLLAIHAKDDPIVSVLPTGVDGYTSSPWVVFTVTGGGGHLGWFEWDPARQRLRRWFTKPVLDWLRTMANDVQIPETSSPRQMKQVDGFWVEEGMEHLGYTFLSSGNVIAHASMQDEIIQGL